MKNTYDSFRVSAVCENGNTVDNDVVDYTGQEAVEAELKATKDWYGNNPMLDYLISYYRDGECVETEYRTK